MSRYCTIDSIVQLSRLKKAAPAKAALGRARARAAPVLHAAYLPPAGLAGCEWWLGGARWSGQGSPCRSEATVLAQGACRGQVERAGIALPALAASRIRPPRRAAGVWGAWAKGPGMASKGGRTAGAFLRPPPCAYPPPPRLSIMSPTPGPVPSRVAGTPSSASARSTNPLASAGRSP